MNKTMAKQCPNCASKGCCEFKMIFNREGGHDTTDWNQPVSYKCLTCGHKWQSPLEDIEDEED